MWAQRGMVISRCVSKPESLVRLIQNLLPAKSTKPSTCVYSKISTFQPICNPAAVILEDKKHVAKVRLMHLYGTHLSYLTFTPLYRAYFFFICDAQGIS